MIKKLFSAIFCQELLGSLGKFHLRDEENRLQKKGLDLENQFCGKFFTCTVVPP